MNTRSKTDSGSKNRVTILYDKQCPTCDFYCSLVRIEQSVGKLVLLDARDSSPLLEEVTKRGWDIDQGMVVAVDDALYYGADAIHMLSLLATRKGGFNRFNYWLFSSEKRAKFFYPLLRTLRNFLLKLLGKRKINNLHQNNNDRF